MIRASAEPISFLVRFGEEHELGKDYQGTCTFTNTGDGGFLISGLLARTPFTEAERNAILSLAKGMGAHYTKMKRLNERGMVRWFCYDLTVDGFPCERID